MNIQTLFSGIAVLISTVAIFSNVFTRLNDLKHLENQYKELKKEVEKIRDCLDETKRKVVEINTRLEEHLKVNE